MERIEQGYGLRWARTVALLLLIAGAVAVTAEGQTTSLTIISEPPGAEIVVDGATVGTTPATVPLAPGRHILKIVKDGYASFERKVSIVQGSQQTIQAQLKEKKKKIGLENIIIGAIGTLQGGNTEGTTTTAGASEPSAQTGSGTGTGGEEAGAGTGTGQGMPGAQTTIAFASVPDGADVRVDGSLIGVTPVSVEADPGSYGIELRKSGYETWTQNVTVLSGEHKQIDATLQASGSAGGQAGAGAGAGTGTPPAQTTIDFASVPDGAEVRVDGSLIGVTPVSVEADPGSYGVEFRKSGYETWTQNVTVLSGEHKQVQTTLLASGSTGSPGGPATVANISGTWYSNIGLTYEITQSGTSFQWYAARLNQNANGTVSGSNVSAVWDGGAASAQGTITSSDSSGRALRIKWNNGVIFFR
jgi:hypothetical protein